MSKRAKPSDPRLIVALDFDTREQALGLARRLQPDLCRLKIGNQLFTRLGPGIIEALHGLGFEVFLDLKFHDIPTTVARASRAAADLGVWMLNVHALGGMRMMEAAAEAVAQTSTPPRLIAVTVLTSHAPEDLGAIGLGDEPDTLAVKLAGLAGEAGLDGVVASAHEASGLRRIFGPEWLIVTPGIRLLGADPGDQRRVLAPRAAMDAGASYLVLGRAVTAADDPVGALRTIASELRR